MKFRYTIQQYQTDAVNSVVNVFKGQQKTDDSTYIRDKGNRRKDVNLFEKEPVEGNLGYANEPVQLDANQLLKNIHTIQAENIITPSDQLVANGLGICSLDVEMETGTGKTYVYIKTMYELNAHYGWSKFIVVVPSIAIREGVRKSFETTQEHFMELYHKKIRYFVYNSSKLDDIDDFSKSSAVSCMIINMQAFNSAFNIEKNKEGRGGDAAARIIFTSRDEFGSRKPIDVIAANRPIVIMDEPQKMGGDKTQKSLKHFKPLFCLNYSATHKEHHNLVYVLDALDAFQKKLVKKIEVKGFELKNLQGANGYLFLESIVVSPSKPPRARLEFEVRHNTAIKRETHIVDVGDNLFVSSHDMEQYRGYVINEIDPIRNLISFTNGQTLQTGEVTGDISEEDLRRIQIRETIRSHFEKERELYGKGIKVLSLFFIDEVAKYRKYDEAGEEVNSLYGQIFEEEYNHIVSEYINLFDSAYTDYLQGIETSKTHAGYFSIDKHGHKIDSKMKRGSEGSDDISAYDLILKDKERLLSLDNPVRFIFSHSALREGWDNPNVFQICTLKHGGDSPTQKRQEVGRGLRLCVNQSGLRMDAGVLDDQVQEINQLTVIASDGYKQFVSDLQTGIQSDLYERPTQLTHEYFEGRQLVLDGNLITITNKQANAIMHYLIKNDYIDDDNHLTAAYRSAVSEGKLAPLPEICQSIEKGVHALVQRVYDPHALDFMIPDGHAPKIHENDLNDNFYKKEFQTLWNYINHKYAYTVSFDSDELIAKARDHIDDKLFVSMLQYTVVSGTQNEGWSSDKPQKGEMFVVDKSRTFVMNPAASQVKYDVVGKIAEGTHLTRRTVATILSKIRPVKFAMFRQNPEEFISKVIRLINEEKATMIVEHISYNQTEGTYNSDIFTSEKHTDFSRAYRAKKNVQDYVFDDGYARNGDSVERAFAKDLDAATEVCVYAKLPKGFAIPTPVGNYSPDWAIAFYVGTVKHIFFIAETKGSMESMDLKPIEQAKISCAKKLFQNLSSKDVVYHEVDSYQSLLNVMDSI
ncbi:type III restriction-modification system endonuclease [Megasphaera hominis]|uniref:DEAD/DEAH box helicase family protein n=1 Tax=Megasphaera hominis TaxID=159836 RepID=A0ABR6VJ37_9FIRM|nr:DEAD/DEAH box helicase family protein [Megasphaera hominis]MBC3537310.1 DEAD/DEAH box helicase family protein [Megasphaera hominis]